MSIEALSWVLKHSEAVKGARLVLLALADTADDDGTNTWPSVKTIARKARLSPRAVHNALRTLEKDGRILRRGTTEFSTTRWDIVLRPSAGSADPTKSADPPLHFSSSEATKSADKPSIEPSIETTPPNPPEPVTAFFAYHAQVTGLRTPREGTKAREAAAATIRARLAEGWTQDDLQAAARGAQADTYRRENGHVTLTSILRPTKIGDLVAKGHAAERRTKNSISSDDQARYRQLGEQARSRAQEDEPHDDDRPF